MKFKIFALLAISFSILSPTAFAFHPDLNDLLTNGCYQQGTFLQFVKKGEAGWDAELLEVDRDNMGMTIARVKDTLMFSHAFKGVLAAQTDKSFFDFTGISDQVLDEVSSKLRSMPSAKVIISITGMGRMFGTTRTQFVIVEGDVLKVRTLGSSAMDAMQSWIAPTAPTVPSALSAFSAPAVPSTL